MVSLFSTHYFTEIKKYQQISAILAKFVEEICKQEEEEFITSLKDEYILTKNPLHTFVR